MCVRADAPAYRAHLLAQRRYVHHSRRERLPVADETALLSVEGTTANYNIILSTENGLDSLEVDVEVTEELFSDKVRSMEGLQQRLTAAVEGLIGLRVRVKLVAPNTIQRSEGKARRVIDRRER